MGVCVRGLVDKIMQYSSDVMKCAERVSRQQYILLSVYFLTGYSIESTFTVLKTSQLPTLIGNCVK